nr:uncharacterized protein LOC109149028 [Ipomoea batatas]GME03901.1 uncharacterized protein LOC109149028 [Ipomoea batatas]
MMNICLEADSWDGIEVDVDRWAPHGLIRIFKCAERVNVVAACLVELCVGANVSFWRREGLPKGLGRILALEGIPHFVFGPGADDHHREREQHILLGSQKRLRSFLVQQ